MGRELVRLPHPPFFSFKAVLRLVVCVCAFGEPSNNGGRVKYNSYQFKLPVNILEQNLICNFFSVALSVLPMAC